MAPKHPILQELYTSPINMEYMETYHTDMKKMKTVSCDKAKQNGSVCEIIVAMEKQ
jgi:hypothetical protein